MGIAPTQITLPIIALRSRHFDVRIDTGELLFPVIVLVFCGVYYADTRGLPVESMLYAEPLLYATAFLAIITIFGHAVSFKTGSVNSSNENNIDSTRWVIWDVESTVVEQEYPQNSGLSKNAGVKASDRSNVDLDPNFNLRSATGLILLTAVYVLSLYFVPFTFATAPFLAATVYLFGERTYLRVIVYSIGFTVLLWFVFINWLQVPLP